MKCVFNLTRQKGKENTKFHNQSVVDPLGIDQLTTERPLQVYNIKHFWGPPPLHLHSCIFNISLFLDKFRSQHKVLLTNLYYFPLGLFRTPPESSLSVECVMQIEMKSGPPPLRASLCLYGNHNWLVWMTWVTAYTELIFVSEQRLIIVGRKRPSWILMLMDILKERRREH